MRATSTEWMTIINYDHFTIYFARHSTLEDIVRTFQRYQKPIGLRFEKTIPVIDSHYTILAQLSNLTRLEVEEGVYSRSNRPLFYSDDLKHFTALTALQKFDFNDLSITKLIIDHFANLTQLSMQAVDSDLIAKLSNPQRLRELEISDYPSATVEFDEMSVAKLSNVSSLNFSGRRSFFPFSKLPNLESLQLYTQRYDDFSTCSKITWLHIEDTTETTLSQLEALANLKHAKFFLNNDDQLRFLSKMTNLECLELHERRALEMTGQAVDFLQPSSKLTKLRVMALTSVETINRFTNLQDLEFQRVGRTVQADWSLQFTRVTRLTVRDVSAASFFPNLRGLLVYNKFSFNACQFISSLTDLESLSTSWNIDNATLQLFGTLTKLTLLATLFDETETYDCHVLQSLTNLTYLKMWPALIRAEVEHRGLWQSIAKLTNLERLEVFCIDDEGIQVLESLPGLKHLNLRMRYDRFDEGRLTNLTNLQTVVLPPGSAITYPHHPRCKLLACLPYFFECSCLSQ